MELRRVSRIEAQMFRRNGSGSGRYVLNKFQLNIVLLELLVKGIKPIVPEKHRKVVVRRESSTPTYRAAKKYASNSTRRPDDRSYIDSITGNVQFDTVFTKHSKKKPAAYRPNKNDIPNLVMALTTDKAACK